MLLKIGELAKRTGLTVRILHHYDKIGLLRPSERSESDYRLYNRDDITRLHRIQALRRLNLSLAEIATLVEQDQVGLENVVSEQLAMLEQQIASSIALRDQLKHLQELLHANQEPQLDYWLGLLEMMSVADKYFTREDLHKLRHHKNGSASPDLRMQKLIKEAKKLLQAGIRPDDAKAKDLAVRWVTTMNETMPSIPRYLTIITKMHRNEPSLQTLTGVDNELMDFITQASIEVRYSIYRKYLSEHELRCFRSSMLKHSLEWDLIFSEVRELIQAGIPATSTQTLTVLRKWRSLFLDAWGGDMATIAKVREIHAKESGVLLGGSITQELMTYARQGLVYLEAEIRQQSN